MNIFCLFFYAVLLMSGCAIKKFVPSANYECETSANCPEGYMCRTKQLKGTECIARKKPSIDIAQPSLNNTMIKKIETQNSGANNVAEMPNKNPDPIPQSSIVEKLKKLKKLRDNGVITNDEYNFKKQPLIDKL